MSIQRIYPKSIKISGHLHSTCEQAHTGHGEQKEQMELIH